MFSSLVRWFECHAENRQPRFIPRLEALDGRVLPGGVPGGVVMNAGDLTVSQVVSNSNISVMHIGEEIPQTTAAARAGDPTPNGGHLDCFGGRGGLGGDF